MAFLQRPYWFAHKVLDQETLNYIEVAAQEEKEKTGVHMGVTGSPGDAQFEHVRKTEVIWIDHLDKKLNDILTYYINIACAESNWNIEWSVFDGFQYGMYGPGGHYDWHIDGAGETTSDMIDDHFGKMRKLSISVSLNNQEMDYRGGDFQIMDGFDNKTGLPIIGTADQLKDAGSIAIFSSDLYHRVTPVTAGERKSLVAWVCGWPEPGYYKNGENRLQ